jgi:hypothetical protein
MVVVRGTSSDKVRSEKKVLAQVEVFSLSCCYKSLLAHMR